MSTSVAELAAEVVKKLVADPKARVLAVCAPGLISDVYAALRSSPRIDLKGILLRETTPGLWTREALPRREPSVTVVSPGVDLPPVRTSMPS